MAKQPGMGDALWIDGLDVSGDIGSLSNISCPMSVQAVAGINRSAEERIGLVHDGAMTYTAFWNPGIAADTAHSSHKTLPTTDRQATYFRGTASGSCAASMVEKQLNYDGTRAADGSFTFGVTGNANGFGLEWGNLLGGKVTQGAAGNGTSVDLGALPISFSFGWAAYLHVFAFTGTSITLKIQDSADNSVWADLSGATFAAVSGAGPYAGQRITAGQTSTATVRRYVRAVSTGTFTNAVFGINFVRYEAGWHQ